MANGSAAAGLDQIAFLIHMSGEYYRISELFSVGGVRGLLSGLDRMLDALERA